VRFISQIGAVCLVGQLTQWSLATFAILFGGSGTLGRRVDRLVPAAVEVLPNPAGRGNPDLITDGGGCAGEGKTLVNLLLLFRWMDGGNWGGPGGTGRDGTAKVSLRTGLPSADNAVGSDSAFFLDRDSISITRCFLVGDFKRGNSVSRDWVSVVVLSFSMRFFDIWGGGPNILE